MAGRRPPLPGHNVKIGLDLYADAIKAAAAHGLNVGQYAERAIAEQIKRDREAWRKTSYDTAEATATKQNQPRPDPVKYGLPADFGIPRP